MRHTWIRPAAGIAALVFLSILAGCGEDETPTSGGGASPSETLAPPAATVQRTAAMPLVEDGSFAVDAFPPTMPDKMWHYDIWTPEECLECHRTGEDDAPVVKHEGLPKRLLKAACRTCHVLIPGSKGRGD